MPLGHRNSRSHQPPQLFGRRIGHQQRAASVCEECNDPSPLLRSGIEAPPAQRLAYLGRPPDDLGRDQVLDHDDSSPAIGETGGWRSGERRLPGAEELGVWPVESADGKFEALADGLQIRLAWKVPRRRTAAVGDRIVEHGNLRNRPAGVAAVPTQHDSAGDADQGHRGGCGRRPASVPEDSAPPRVGSADLLDAPAPVSRRPANGLLSERPREVLLQRQLAPAARASAQVLPDDATLIGGKLAVGECGNQPQEPRMFEGGLSDRMSFLLPALVLPSGRPPIATPRRARLFPRQRGPQVATPRLALFSPVRVSSPASNCRPRLMRLMTVPIGTEVIRAISLYFRPCTS